MSEGLGTIDYVPHGRLGIRRSSTLRLDDAQGSLIYVWHGTVWLTQERDSRDHLLRTGDSFQLDRAGMALISSVGDGAVISLTPQRQQERAAVFAKPVFAFR